MLKFIKGGGDQQDQAPGCRVGTGDAAPQRRKEVRHQQLIMLDEAHWLRGPQGTMSLADMLQTAGFEVGKGHSPGNMPDIQR
eukprot:3356874-Karenia_brevis.AAC.1